jgi:hypothetical protein
MNTTTAKMQHAPTTPMTMKTQSGNPSSTTAYNKNDDVYS